MNIIIILGIGLILIFIRYLRRPKKIKKASFLIVLGSGGHTGEMLEILNSVVVPLGDLTKRLIFVIAESDTTSEDKLYNWLKSNDRRYEHIVERIPRSREVGQSYVNSIYPTIMSLWWSIILLFKFRTEFIIVNGPGTCLPICYCAILWDVLLLRRTVVIFIESFCRTRTLSLTAKLCRPICDDLFVYWPELNRKYPESKLIGRKDL